MPPEHRTASESPSIDASLTRREILRRGAVAPLAGAAALSAAPATRAVRTRRDDGSVPKNIIWMVSDGMSAGVPTMAEPFSRLLRGRETAWSRLSRQEEGVRHGLLETGSLCSMVTDSAAASTAWSSGTSVFNGSLNVLPDGTELTPLAPLVREKGKAVGLVTTTKITHATPAGFAAIAANRDDEQDIAPQYLDLVDVALGGGQKFFDPKRRKDGMDAYEPYRSAGYAVCTKRDELLAARNADRILGCFRDDHLPYTIDQHHRPEEHADVPTLAEMSKVALDLLDRKPGGSFLMIEGGRIDHAAHDNDPAGILWDQLAFDDAIAAVLEHIEGRDDTLLVITTDHGNANPGLNGMSSRYMGSDAAFERLAAITMSFESMYAALKREQGEGPISNDLVADFLLEHAGFVPDKEEQSAIADCLAGRSFRDLHRQDRGIVGALGQTFANHTGVGWTGVTHTSDWGLLLATGPGSERFGRQMSHAEAHRAIADLWSIAHRNPAMSPDAARRFLASVPARRRHGRESDGLLAHV